MAKLTKNLAPLFDSSISYEPGERFMYGDHMYEALEPLSGAFDSTKVSEVTLADIFKGVSSNDVKCLAPEYDVNTEYSVENLVLHDGVLYECVEATTGPFDETKWSRKYLSDVGGLNSNLNKIIKLGTGTSFDVSTYNGYQNFTVDNFIVEATALAARLRNPDSTISTLSANWDVTQTAEIIKNYDSDKGLFTLPDSYAHSQGGLIISQARLFEPTVYLVIGNIE